MRTLVSSLVLSWLLPALAAAQTAPAATPGADAYTQRVQRGIEQLAGGDPSGAMATFRAAQGMDGARPQAVYYLAVAHRVTGAFAEAVTTFQQAAALAQAQNLPRWRARALHGVASTLERIEGRVEEARAAWLEYTRFADGNATVADPQLGRARITAIDAMNEQEQVYVQVRQRIAEREEERRREQDDARPARRR